MRYAGCVLILMLLAGLGGCGGAKVKPPEASLEAPLPLYEPQATNLTPEQKQIEQFLSKNGFNGNGSKPTVIVIHKIARKLTIYQGLTPLKTYPIVLGNDPYNDKLCQGDTCTPEGVYKVRRPVEWHDLDLAGHVNNAMYLNYAADCAMQLARELGWPLQRMLETGAVNWVRRHQLQHLQSALLGDELEIATWLAHVENSQAVRYTTIRRVDDQGEAGEVLARVHAHEQWVDVRTGQPRPAPEEVLADFSANIAG